MSATVETARLALRPFAEADLAPLAAALADPAVTTYFGKRRPYDADEAAVFLRTHAAERARRGFAPWTAALRATGTVVGWGGLAVDPFDPGWGPEVLYFLRRASWGRGLASELVAASVQVGFAAHRLPHIDAFVHPENAASIRVLVTAGFERVGFEHRLDRDRYRIACPSER